MVLVPDDNLRGGSRSGLLILSCGTDNLDNTYVLDRLLTTKYPLGVVLMEVAHQCRRRASRSEPTGCPGWRIGRPTT